MEYLLASSGSLLLYLIVLLSVLFMFAACFVATRLFELALKLACIKLGRLPSNKPRD